MSRRKTWDTEDPNRLRRSLLSADAYLDDKYYTRFVSSGSMVVSDNAVLTHLNSTFPVIQCPTAVTSTASWAIDWPEHWRYGRLTSKQYWRHDNSVGAAAFIPAVLVESQAVGEPAGRGTIIAAAQSVETLGSGGSLNQVVTYEVESSSVENKKRSSGEQEILGGYVKRIGGGSDTMAGDMYCLGVKLTWKPEPR